MNVDEPLSPIAGTGDFTLYASERLIRYYKKVTRWAIDNMKKIPPGIVYEFGGFFLVLKKKKKILIIPDEVAQDLNPK